VAGAVTGGSALVVQPGFDASTVAKFKGKRIATPEFGNTQDIAARAWLSAGGLVVGKDVQVVPIPNPDQINLFRLVAIDGAWTIEPWVSRLELLADAKVVVEEKDPLTTLLAANTQFLTRHAELADAFIAAHRELTEWIIQHPQEAQRMLTEELQIRFKADMPEVVLRNAWPRIHLTSDVSLVEFAGFLAKAKDAGFVSNVDMRSVVETCIAGPCTKPTVSPQTN
jgi:NitT/TauT family transport system substrate-binding protein